MSQKTNISRKVDLTSEVSGTLPLANSDPSLTGVVQNYYSLGTSGDGLPITTAKDNTNQLPFLRLQAGENITVSKSSDGNALVITASSSVGGSGDMLKSVYDVDNDGVVNEARLADAVAWSNITGVPSTFPPSAHNQAESTITGNTIAGATGGLVGDLGALVPIATLVNTQYSLTGGGNLSANRTLNLVGDVATPGNNQRYGTNGSGTRGWVADPYLAGGMAVSVYATNGHAGWVDTAVVANSVAAGAVTSGSIAAGAVTSSALGTASVTGVKIASGAIAASLGYSPVSKSGDTMSGPLDITANGPTINTIAWQNAHLLLQTSGSGTGYPVLGFSRFNTGDSTGGGVAVYYSGNHEDFNLVYADGTTGQLLSTNSLISGTQIAPASIGAGVLASGSVTAGTLAAGSVTAGKIGAGVVVASDLAAGVAVANLGFTPSNPGSFTNAFPGAITFIREVGITAASYASAPILISNNENASARPGIGFVNEGIIGCYLWLDTNGQMKFTLSDGDTYIISTTLA